MIFPMEVFPQHKWSAYPQRNRPLRVALLQLPVQEADSFYTEANIPLAAGYLAAFQRTYAPSLAEIVIPDPTLQNLGGDAALVQWILGGDFDIVGFTLYLWNRDRSLYLARRIRGADPECLLVAGGPEVANPRGLEVFHVLFEGEGEETFLQFLQGVQSGNLHLPTPTEAPLSLQQAESLSKAEHESLSPEFTLSSPQTPHLPLLFAQKEPLSLDRVPNPYLTGVLPLGPNVPLYLETLRGCRRRCSYCSYGKAFPYVRHFPPDRLAPLFSLASGRGVPEIYLMDPSFNVGGAKELETRVRLLEQVNTSGIPLHTELVLESVTKDLTRRMRRAGFRSVEVGLQSTNFRVLKAVRRPLDLSRFRRGAGYLKEEGIEVRTGVILGLPEDDLEGFRKTLDFVEELHLEDALEVYLLSLLPGTELRERAEELGILYMEHPPYWVLETPTFPAEDLYEGIVELEDRYGIEYQRPILPDFSNTGPFLTYIDLRQGIEQKPLTQLAREISWNLTLSLSSAQLGKPEKRKILLEWAHHLFKSNPYTYYRIVLHDDAPTLYPLDSPPLQQALEDLVHTLFLPTHYGNLSRTFVQDPQGRFTVRVFVQTQDPRTRRRMEELGIQVIEDPGTD